MDVTFTIVDTAETLAFTPLSVRGFDDVDDFRLVTTSRRVATNGEVSQRALGFQRLITVALGCVTSPTSQQFLVRWLRAAERSLTYGSETAQVTLKEPRDFSTEHAAGNRFRRFTLEVWDRTVRHDPPASWQDEPIVWTSWTQTNIHPFYDTDYTFADLT